MRQKEAQHVDHALRELPGESGHEANRRNDDNKSLDSVVKALKELDEHALHNHP